MNKNKFVVVSYWCGESGETSVWPCDSEKDAIEKMQRLWEKSYNFALKDENFDEERSYHQEDIACVAWKDELFRFFEVVETKEEEEV